MRGPSPATVYFEPRGGTAEVYVKGSALTCTFSAKSEYPWISVSSKQQDGEGKVSVTVGGNTSMTHRVGSVLIKWRRSEHHPVRLQDQRRGGKTPPVCKGNPEKKY